MHFGVHSFLGSHFVCSLPNINTFQHFFPYVTDLSSSSDCIERAALDHAGRQEEYLYGTSYMSLLFTPNQKAAADRSVQSQEKRQLL